MADLVPERPAENGDYVELGKLRVEKAHYAEFRMALLDNDVPEVAAIVERLETGPRKTTVHMVDSLDNNHMHREPSGDALVTWNPKDLMIGTNGSRQTPAEGLIHELDHADDWTHHPQQHKAREARKDDRYDDAEERRVITGVEAHLGRLHGDGVRTDHKSAHHFDTYNPNSTLPILYQFRDGVESRVATGYSQTGRLSFDDNGNVVQDVGRGKTVKYDRDDLEFLVGKDKVERAVHDGKPMTVSNPDGHIRLDAPRQLEHPQGVNR